MPHYTYTLLLQLSSAHESAKDDTALAADFHSMLRDSVEHEAQEMKRNNTESVQRAISRLRGTLIPYLSTPLKSDKDDIERSIKDTIDDVLSQSGFSAGSGTGSSDIFQILEPAQIQLHRQIVGVVKRLLKNGKAMLAEAGIQSGKNAGTSYLVQLSFEGFSTVTTFRRAIERINVGTTKPEIIIRNDALNETLVANAQDASTSDNTVILYFDANPSVIDALTGTIPSLVNRFGIANILLNKRSLYSGLGSPYQLQFTTNLKKHPLGTILLALIGEDADLEEAITEQGALIVVEKVS